ncbi:MauE/DoxX family redox-associated membrane protein [Bacillus sp. 123MFChir2]|uniref:MauE/DoxX family redox-associated membrane protein n=1 Tax=Bacillus sp. 123MFChir2 TaxID=1169144 RepID=UPI000367F45D|nr:MauE/DoxX family redox-associated membrane protein [Bacillus sp. 123MFChir2]
MEELSLILRLCLGSIFIGTFVSKIRDFRSHIDIIRKYQILPENSIVFLAYIEIAFELVIGIGIILGFVVNLMSLLAAFLLSLYTLAIIINLIRRNTDFNCGCGGVLGDYKLSWNLVIRNVLLLFIAIFIYYMPHQIGTVDEYLKVKDISIMFNETVICIATTFVLIYVFIFILRGFIRLNN